MSPEQWLERFKHAVAQPPDKLNVAEAALIIAADEYPDLEIETELAKLDALAEQVGPRVRAAGEPHAKLEELNRFLFDRLQFRGNREYYYDPHNSYLNDVLRRRVGLPITLSLIYIEVGRRLGLPLYGVGLPGHFIVKWKERETEIFVDPFNEGEIINELGLLRLLEDTYKQPVPLERDWLDAVGPQFILLRILNNLKGIFLHRQDHERALMVTDKLLVLEPGSPENLRDAGLLSFRVGAFRRAVGLLEEYLLQHPESRESAHVRIYLRSARVSIARLN